jgi:hypothetical protein
MFRAPPRRHHTLPTREVGKSSECCSQPWRVAATVDRYPGALHVRTSCGVSLGTRADEWSSEYFPEPRGGAERAEPYTEFAGSYRPDSR